VTTAGRTLARAEALRERHESLCFQRAFPRNAAALRRAMQLLAGFERRVGPVRNALENSGIAGTLYSYPFNYRMTRWLAGRYGPSVSIDWKAYKRHEWDEIAGALSLCVAWAENEGLDDDDLPSWDWIALAKKGSRRTDLEWLLGMLQRAGFDPEGERYLFESLSLPLIWDLAGCPDAITNARLPVRRVFYHREFLHGRPGNFADAVREARGAFRLVTPRQADRLIDAARAALSQREREFHVIVHANRDETYLHDAGRGLEVAVFGLVKPLRLTLEADYGALLIKNGVPIGYGYAALVFDRADIAINIFPTYRAGESPYVFTRFAALFHHHFGAQKLVMRRYQLGWQNPEGIEAGSFWFYYKLGFRPADARLRRVADAEAERLARRKGAKSNEVMLRRLARSDMVLCLDGAPVERFRDVDLKRIGLAVTRLIEHRFGGDRRAAVESLTRAVSRRLAVPRVASARPRIAPVAALIPDLARWTGKEKRRLAAILLAKEGKREGPFVLAMLRHERFRRFLETRFGLHA
jgi:hypothetical protein